VPKTGAPAGQAIFATRCASCHGADGGGGFGPTLAGVVASRYPDPADQEAVVANGRGAMPSFSDSLTPQQIRAVVDFTRTALG
jgi:mono/diheme cytochrome c family protein